MTSDPTPTVPASSPLERSTEPRRVRTMADEQADALQEEFPEFQIWVDFRPMEDGHLHWHARQSDWSVTDIINARDAQNMRDELIIWYREHPTGE